MRLGGGSVTRRLVQNFVPAPPIFAWKPLKIGGGGFTRDLDIAPDGTKVCKVDVYGAYVWNPNVASTGNMGGLGLWQQLCKPGPIPVGDPAFTLGNVFSGSFNFFGSQGAWDVRIAPSNSSIIYMLWCGMMYKSTNKGVTFVNQSSNAGGSFPRQTAANSQSNGGGLGQLNGTGPPMAVDPQNPNVCWLGTLGGVFFTQDGGTTWNTLSTSLLPLPTPTGYGWYGFAFDPKSAVTSGKTQGIYCYVCGTGVYYSSDAGTSWTLLSGGGFSGTMPTLCTRIVVDQFGVAWIVVDWIHPSTTTNNLRNFTVQSGTAYTANTWTVSGASVGSNGIWGVAPDPASASSAAQRVIVTDWAGAVAQTTNGGSSWTPAQAFSNNLVANDCPWLATNESNFSLNGCPKFDPAQSNALFYPEGIGIWYASPPTIGGGGSWGSWPWVSLTVGIESLETTDIISPPGGFVGLAQWDRNWFVLNNSSPDTTPFPLTYGTKVGQAAIVAGQGIDWAGQNPSFVVIQGGFSDAYSTTGGSPAISGWSAYTVSPPFPADPNGAAGVAVSTSTSIMTVAGGLFATTNGGATTWSDVTPAGTSWGNGGAQTSIPLAADKVTAGYYVGVTGLDIYYSANTGSSWTKVTPGFSIGSASGGPQIKAIPNNAGHYFYTAGGSFGSTVDSSNVFYRSTDGGHTWQDVSQGGYTVREVWVWGFGKSNGGTYPTIFIYGYVNSVLGVWQSTDNCVSWQKIGDQQFGGSTFDVPNCMSGDMNTAGVVYVGFFGSGYLQYNS